MFEAKWKSAGYVTICIFMQTVLAQLWAGPTLISSTCPEGWPSPGNDVFAAAFVLRLEVSA